MEAERWHYIHLTKNLKDYSDNSNMKLNIVKKPKRNKLFTKHMVDK